MLFLSCVLLFGVWPKVVIGDVCGTTRRCPRLLQTQAMLMRQHLSLLSIILLLCLYFVVDLLVLLGVTGGRSALRVASNKLV